MKRKLELDVWELKIGLRFWDFDDSGYKYYTWSPMRQKWVDI